MQELQRDKFYYYLSDEKYKVQKLILTINPNLLRDRIEVFAKRKTNNKKEEPIPR